MRRGGIFTHVFSFNHLMKTADQKHIVIIGGGFGGLNAALALKIKPVKITLIDKRNFHLFQPLLYQVASGGLSPADIAYPLRALFKDRSNIQVLMDEVTDIDLSNRQIQLNDRPVKFDYLIIAAGARNFYFGHEQWEKIATGLKPIEDATTIRSKILSAFEQAEKETDPEKKAALLTFAIVGGGPAGVEMAGAIAEISRNTLRHDFRNIDPSQARIILIEGSDRVLPVYPENLSIRAAKRLQKLGVEVICGHMVKKIRNDRIELDDGETTSRIDTATTIWAAGVRAASLATLLINKYGIAGDKNGRIIVDKNCTIPGHRDVFVIGDMANFPVDGDEILPGVAPVAIQQARYVARVIINRLKGKKTKDFAYKDKGNLAVIGRKSAVGYRKNTEISGLLAWLIWLFVHLLYLVGFENRLLVAVQWATNYITFNRSARLIANYTVDE